ncbi:MAG: PASTA domain-containing protein, partial [Actinomycetota bacterium]|nr:PASTA domain-containing protein [Actinomycetota bacterium]
GTKLAQGRPVTLTISTGPGDRNVPTVAQLPLKQAQSAIVHAGLRAGRVITEQSTTIPAGEVIRSDPGAGTSILAASPVTLFVSSGRPLATVPEVRGSTVGAAKGKLRQAGLTSSITDVVSSTSAPGLVISENPSVGSQVPPGSAVSLTVAKAPPTVQVPNVLGLSAAAAAAKLAGDGFTVVDRPFDVKKLSNDGRVLKQSPFAGAQKQKNSTVTIYVGQYTPPTTTTH